MSVETGTTLAQLDQTWPQASDQILEGDDHIRLIKAILKAQFPGTGGLGLNTPIIATEAELNYLQGVTSAIQTQIDAALAQSQAAIDATVVNADAIALKADKTYVDVQLDLKAELVSSDTEFGGFKHTFSNGVLNLITV